MIREDSFDPHSEREQLDLLVEEFSTRRRRGEPSTIVEEYLDRYPHLADELRVILPTLEFVERATQNVLSEERPGAGRLVGERLGDYRIVRELARGGMGVVYEAYQESLDRHVALKVLPVQATLEPRFLERFQREAQAAASLQHPNIVPVYGVGEHDGFHFYVMQYIEGKGLDEVISEVRRRLGRGSDSRPRSDSSLGEAVEFLLTGAEAPPPGETPPVLPTRRWREDGHRSRYYRGVANLGRQAAEALAAAHEREILHRDIKPSNLLLDADGRLWVTDFGLCKTGDSGELTQSGDLLGTLRFLPPERLEGKSGPAGDIYGLGITLYELITLRPAFEFSDRAQLLHRLTHETPPRPSTIVPSVPRDLETIIMKAMARAPHDRYRTADDLAADLEAFLDGRPIIARPPTLAYVFRMTVRRNKLLAGTIAASAVVVLLLTFLYVVGLNRSLRQARVAGLASAASEAVHTDPMLGLLLAREAVQLERSPTTLSQLQRALAALRERAELTGHDEAVEQVEFSASGDRLLTQSRGSLRLWTSIGEEEIELEGHRGDILDARFSPAGDRVVSADSSGEVRVWALDGTCQLVLKHGAGVSMAKITPEGSIITAAADGTASVWNPDGSRQRILAGHQGPLTSVSAAIDGSHYLTTGRDGARLWNAVGTEISRWSDSRHGSIRGGEFSRSGDRVLEYGASEARLWDLEGRRIATLRGHREQLTSATLSPHGDRVVTSSDDQTARLWDASGRTLAVFGGHGGGVTSARFSPDGERIITTSNDQTARLWDLRGNLLAQFQGHESRVLGASFSPEGRKLVTGSGDRTARIWDVESEDLPVLRGHRGGLYAAVFDPAGTSIFTASRDFTGRLWTIDGRLLQVFEGHHNWVFSAEFTGDGQRIFTTAESPQAILWNRDGSIDSVVSVSRGRVLSASLDEAGIHCVLARAEPNVVVVQDPQGREICLYDEHEAIVWSARFDPDREWVLSASGDQTARVWDLSGRTLLVLHGHRGPVRYARFSPDGETIVTASSDGTARLWDRRGKTVAILEGHEGTVLNAAFSPDGQRVLTCSRDQTARVWNLEGELLMILSGHKGLVWTAEFSPDGRRVVTASNDNTARVWRIEAADLLELADRRAFRGFRPKERARYRELLD